MLKFISTGNFGDTEINGAELESWRKRAKLFTVQNENVLWQATNYCKDKRFLGKVLLDEGCALPPFMEGVERACAL